MRFEIAVNLTPPYTATVERGGLAAGGALAARHLPPGGRAVVITSPRIRGLWGAHLEAALQAAAVPFTVLTLSDGEQHKRLTELEALADAMLAAGCDRQTLVIAFGGGVVGDVAAFLASIYMRGVALLQIPTTLLAMVDSSLGGKTGVNLAGGKNLLGTFHHPRAILADPALLSTLAEREYRSGLAEAIKYAIIADAALFDTITAAASALRRQSPESLDPLDRLIAACLAHKAAIVAADEREGDRRRVLNFGHTLGHALESASGYQRYLHGEAVAWGMIAATRIAVRLGRCPEAAADRITAAILALCGPLPPLVEDPALLLRLAAGDKKSRAGQLHFILPSAIGRVEIATGIPDAVVLATLADAARITTAPAPAAQ